MLKNAKSITYIVSGLGLIILYLWILYAGKDINFDLLNYHIYSFDNFYKGRYKQDFMAASIQSYLTPYLYFPFYLAFQWKINDYFFAFFLACVHYLNLVILWKISNIIFKDKNELYKKILFVVFGALCPIFLITVGTSFSDPITSIFVLYSLYLLIQDDVSYRKIALAAIIIGFSISCKLTNGLYFPSLLPIVFFRKGITGCFKFMLMASIAFAITYFPIGYNLYVNYNNPFFPFFNELFQSEFFLKEAIHDKRFLGSGVFGAFMLPFEMLKSNSWIYAEVPVPFLFPIVVVVLFIASLFFKKNKKTKEIEILIFFIVSFLMWAISSRIGRYALPTLILAGPLIISLLSNIFLKKDKFILVALILMASQILIYSPIGENRWTTVPWSNGPWINIQTSQNLKDKKSLILTTNAQTFSIISSEIHEKSSIINLTGQVPISPDLEKVKVFINNNKLIYGTFMRQTKSDIDINDKLILDFDEIERLKNIFLPYGLTPGGTECFSSKFDDINKELLYCDLKKISAKASNEALINKRKYDDIFTKIENICPALFSPKGGETNASQKIHSRNYINTANYLIIDNGYLINYNHRSLVTDVIGNIEEMRDVTFWNNFHCPERVKKRYLD